MDKLKPSEDIPRKQMGFIKFPNRSYPVYEGLNIIGRDSKATIRVKDLTFSKQHATIIVVNDTSHYVSDFGSSNGTEVRLQKLIPFKLYEINDQETITFGDIVAEYNTGADPNFDKENCFNETQSQFMDANATTQLLTHNIHDLPTQKIVIDNKNDKNTSQTNTQNIHEAETQPILKTNDDLDKSKDAVDSQLLSKPTAILETQNNNTCTENYTDISRSEFYDDIFANETFRQSLQNVGSKYHEIVDETLPNDPKFNKSTDVSMDSDDIILSTQDNAIIEQQTQQIILKQNKPDSKKEQNDPPNNKDDDDSATDIEDEEEFMKKIQEKSTQFNDSKNKNDSGSETDAEDDLAKKTTLPPLDDSTTDIEDSLIANCDFNIKPSNVEKSQEPQAKMSDENDEALLLVPTQLLDNKKPSNIDEESDDDEVDLMAGAPPELLQEQNDENDDDLLAPTQLLTVAPKSHENKDPELLTANKNQADDDGDETDDDLLAPTQLLGAKSNKTDMAPKTSIDDEDDDLLAPTQLLSTKSIEETPKNDLTPKPTNNKADDDDLLAPTQLLESKNIQNNVEDIDDDDLPPTQLLSNENIAKKIDEIDDEAPTQLLQPKNANDSIFSAPTQLLEKSPFVSPRKSILGTKSPRNKEKRSVNFSEDVIYDMPTQKLDTSVDKSIFEAPTQLLESKANQSVENIHEAPTQLLDNKSLNDSSSIEESNLDNTQGSKNASLKLVLSETDDECSDLSKINKSDTKNIETNPKEINPQPETQLEVDFDLETQKLYIEEKTSRPDNPLGHMFGEEPTQMTEDIIEVQPEPKQKENEPEPKLGENKLERNRKENKSEPKIENIESSRKLQVKLSNIIDLSEASTSKTNSSTSDEADFKPETKKGRPKKQKKEEKVPQNIPKLVITKLKPSEVNQKKKQEEKSNESIVKSSETDEDKPHNTRGKRISYQKLNTGKAENKKPTRGRGKKTEAEEPKKEELEVKKTSRASTRRTAQLQTPKTEDKNDNSSDLDDFINRVTRSKRTHSVAETPKKKSVEDSDSDSSIVTKKKVKKLEYTQETEPSSINSEIVKEKPAKRSMKIENYSSDENTDNTTSFCVNTPNTKRRRYEPLSVTLNNTQGSGETVRHKVVFTMLSDTTLESSVKKLGGSITDSAQQSTVLVTNKISRSLKFLTAVALGKPIAQAKWIHDSVKKNVFQDPWNYLLEDTESEAKFNFSLKDSLKRSSEKLLLTGMTFLIAGKKNCDVLKEIIATSGGKCIARAPAKNVPAIVISYEEEKAKYAKYLKQKNLTVVSAEAIFSGVLRQEVNWNQHLLS